MYILRRQVKEGNGEQLFISYSTSSACTVGYFSGLLCGYCALCRTVIIEAKKEKERKGDDDAANHPPKWAQVMNRLLFPPFRRKLSPLSLSREGERETGGRMRGCRNEICLSTIFSGTDSYLPSRGSLRNRHISFRS